MVIQKPLEKILKIIVKYYKPEKVVLFGSYAYGHPNKNSDLDLLVVKDSNLPRYKRAREIRKYLWGITDIPKDIIVYTQKEIDDLAEIKEAFITDILKNGIILYESKKRINR